MERGLLWLPLLIVFFWLAWAGWNEYQKVEAYHRWAEGFDRAKYDIYAVLGQKGDAISWGKPTRGEPVELETFSLQAVRTIRLRVDDAIVDWAGELPEKGRAVLVFELGDRTIEVPFTDISLAAQWGEFLEGQRQELQASSSQLAGE